MSSQNSQRIPENWKHADIYVKENWNGEEIGGIENGRKVFFIPREIPPCLSLYNWSKLTCDPHRLVLERWVLRGGATWSSHSLSSHLYKGCDPDTCLTGSLWVLTRLYEQQGGTHCTTAVTVVVCILSSSSGASLVAQLVKNPLQWGRPGFDPWVGKIPWRRERLSTPVFWPGKFHVLHSPWGRKESDTTERLSLSLFKLHS